jgi:hypothetical protein
MEEGCPMGDRPAAQAREHEAQDAGDKATLTPADLPGGSHGCGLADACAPITTALVSKRVVRVPSEVVSQSIPLSTDPVPDQARFAPPTPPPNA